MATICQRCNHENSDEARFCLKCGAMLEMETAEGADPLIGKVLLGRYRVVRLIGEGGMGKVYLSEQKMGTATRKVAIKTLHAELSNDPQVVGRFQRECETVIELTHPNTVQFYDFGELDDSTLFIVMEYIEGESLSDVLHKGAIDAARADKILIQICGSLNEAHDRGIVHRDLKPENVLLTDRGGQNDFVKVLDFGIAKQSEAEDQKRTKLTQQGMVLGTPPYMSPEQFGGQTLDARSDVYSLGVMLYEMVTGELPFEAATPWEWATKHLTAQPNPLHEHQVGAMLPDYKRATIMKALSKAREDRPQSVLALMKMFTGVEDTQTAWARATAPGPISTRPISNTIPKGRTTHTPGAMPTQSVGAVTPVTGTMASFTTNPTAAVELPGAASKKKKKALFAVAATFVLATLGGGLWASGVLPNSQQEKLALGTSKTLVPKVEVPKQNAVEKVNPTDSVEKKEPIKDDKQLAEIDKQKTEQIGASQEPSNTKAEPSKAEPQQKTSEKVEPAAKPTKTKSKSKKRTVRKARKEKKASKPESNSSENIAKGKALINEGKSELTKSNANLNGAISALRSAQKILGGSDSSVRSLRNQLGKVASNKVGILMLKGQCKGAQNLYKSLRSVGAEKPSKVHFSSDWCPAP